MGLLPTAGKTAASHPIGVWGKWPLGMANRCKPIAPARFRLEGIYREGFITAATRMTDIVNTAADGPTIPKVYQIKYQRRVHSNGGVQG